MEKRFLWLFVFIFVAGFVCADDDFGSISRGGDPDLPGLPGLPDSSGGDSDDSDSYNGDSPDDVDSGDESGSDDDASSDEDSSSSLGEGKYTANFYVALGLGCVGVLIVALFAYLFFRRPKNRWKK